MVNFAAGGVATPADAALMMQMGMDGVFVGSGIFKAGDPAKRAKAIVQVSQNIVPSIHPLFAACKNFNAYCVAPEWHLEARKILLVLSHMVLICAELLLLSPQL